MASAMLGPSAWSHCARVRLRAAGPTVWQVQGPCWFPAEGWRAESCLEHAATGVRVSGVLALSAMSEAPQGSKPRPLAELPHAGTRAGHRTRALLLSGHGQQPPDRDPRLLERLHPAQPSATQAGEPVAAAPQLQGPTALPTGLAPSLVACIAPRCQAARWARQRVRLQRTASVLCAVPGQEERAPHTIPSRGGRAGVGKHPCDPVAGRLGRTQRSAQHVPTRLLLPSAPRPQGLWGGGEGVHGWSPLACDKGELTFGDLSYQSICCPHAPGEG